MYLPPCVFWVSEKYNFILQTAHHSIACIKIADHPSPALLVGADVFSSCVYGANKGVCLCSLVQQVLLVFA